MAITATLTRPALERGAIVTPEQVEGNIFTPTIPGTWKRVFMLIDAADSEKFDELPRGSESAVEVFDLLTQQDFKVKTAPCGAGCYCGAEIVFDTLSSLYPDAN